MYHISKHKFKDIHYNTKVITLSQRVFTAIIVLWPILNVYHSRISIKIGIGDVLLLLIMAVYATDVMKKKLIITDYLLFTAYIIIISFIDVAITYGGSVPIFILLRILRYVFFGIVICVYLPRYFNLQYGISLMKKCSCIVTFGIMLQSIIFYLFHKAVFLWLPVEYFMSGDSRAARISGFERLAQNSVIRFASVFREPAHFSEYVIVGMLLFLFCEKRKDRVIIGASFCSFGILLSTSAGGILAMILGWVIWSMSIIMKALKKGKIERYIYFTFIFLIAIVVGLLCFTNLGNYLVTRINGIRDTRNASGNLRVVRGYLVFRELNIWRKIFGTGIGNIVEYFEKMHMSLPMSYGDKGDAMNSFTYILNSTGLCGTGLLLVVLIRRMFRGNYFFLALGLIVLTLLLESDVFGQGYWVMYMAFLLYSRKDSFEVVKAKGNTKIT